MAKPKMKPRIERRSVEYNSLEDVHLAHHFRKPSIFKHLVKMGLVSGNGRIVPEKEWDKNQRKKRSTIKTIKSNSVPSSFMEGNLRPFKKNVNKERDQTSAPNSRRLPFPVFPSRIGITGEPYLLSYIFSLQKKRAKRVSPLSRSQSRSKVWDRLCPTPSSGNMSVCSLKRKPTEKTKLKVKYLARNETSQMVITQQPSGTYTVPIFSGKVSDGDVFEINSCRRTDAPFSLVIYEEGICTRRINTCCETKLSPGKKIRCLSGHILIMENEGGQPCPKCYFEMSPREIDLREKFLKMRESEKGENETKEKNHINKSSLKATDSEGQDSYTDIFTNESETDSESQDEDETSKDDSKKSSDHSNSTNDSDNGSGTESEEGTHGSTNSGENKSASSVSASSSVSKSASTSTSKSASKSASASASASGSGSSRSSSSSSASSCKSQIPDKETAAKSEVRETAEYSDTTSQSSNIMDDDD